MISRERAKALRDAIDAVKAMTAERQAIFPKYPPYQHAAEQIAFIESFLNRDVIPSIEQVSTIDIGLMAVREFETDDPEYARSLMRANGRFEDLLES
jgi:Tsi6